MPIVEAGEANTVTEPTVEESTDENTTVLEPTTVPELTAVPEIISIPEPTPDIDETINDENRIHIPADAIPIQVKISHYDPNLGGTNCAAWYDGGCASHLANGERWQDYYEEGRTIACPMSVPFGSIIYLDNIAYTCRDRGGAIVITWEGYYWIDILEEHASYKYGEVRDAYLYIP